MNKFLDILTAVLKGKYVDPKFDIESKGQIDMCLKLIDGKVNIIFGPNKPVAVGKYILRIRLPINSVTFDGDTMYVNPDGWRAIPISLKDVGV